jgi:hypothetical protein
MDNATYKLTTETLHAMNNKLVVGGILCDLQKAFECINHNILLSKLKFYGISGKAYALYKSYLENRYQRTVLYNEKDICNEVAKWAKVKNGVPQDCFVTFAVSYTHK